MDEQRKSSAGTLSQSLARACGPCLDRPTLNQQRDIVKCTQGHPIFFDLNAKFLT
jgi:hypothetical protein